MKPRGTAQGAPMRAPLTAVSAFQRRALAHFLRRPRTGKIATSVITRVYAEKAAQRNGSVRLCEAQLWVAMCGTCKRPGRWLRWLAAQTTLSEPDVCLEAHCGLKSDIAPCLKSATSGRPSLARCSPASPSIADIKWLLRSSG